MEILKTGVALAALFASVGTASAQQSQGDAFRAIGQALQHIQNETGGRGTAAPGMPADGAAGPTLTISGTVSAAVGYGPAALRKRSPLPSRTP